MKIKVNKHKLNIHYWGSLWGSRTQQHAYCLRYAHSHHLESYLGKKQPQAKIAITFLFGQLHFNIVTSHALFYGGHLVMRSKRCAVQNQGITLRISWPYNTFPRIEWIAAAGPNWRNGVGIYYILSLLKQVTMNIIFPGIPLPALQAQKGEGEEEGEP